MSDSSEVDLLVVFGDVRDDDFYEEVEQYSYDDYWAYDIDSLLSENKENRDIICLFDQDEEIYYLFENITHKPFAYMNADMRGYRGVLITCLDYHNLKEGEERPFKRSRIGQLEEEDKADVDAMFRDDFEDYTEVDADTPPPSPHQPEPEIFEVYEDPVELDLNKAPGVEVINLIDDEDTIQYVDGPEEDTSIISPLLEVRNPNVELIGFRNIPPTQGRRIGHGPSSAIWQG